MREQALDLEVAELAQAGQTRGRFRGRCAETREAGVHLEMHPSGATRGRSGLVDESRIIQVPHDERAIRGDGGLGLRAVRGAGEHEHRRGDPGPADDQRLFHREHREHRRSRLGQRLGDGFDAVAVGVVFHDRDHLAAASVPQRDEVRRDRVEIDVDDGRPQRYGDTHRRARAGSDSRSRR